MRRLIATTALATAVLLLAGCEPPETPVANDVVETDVEPVGNTIKDGNLADDASEGPPEPTTDGSDDRIAAD